MSIVILPDLVEYKYKANLEMTAKFVEAEKGICLFINNEEITYFFKEDHTTSNGKTITIDVCANDFELDNDEVSKLLMLPNSLIPKCFDYYKENYKSIQDGHIALFIDSYHVGLVVVHELDSWTNQYRYTDFLDCYTKLLSKGEFSIELDLTLTLSFDETHQNSMLPQVTAAIEWLNKCYVEAQNILIKNIQSDVFTKFFDFPPEYKNICSQYLVWFGEFLKNLNINAHISTEQTKTKTKIIIAPEDCPDLTGKIESLFYQYLALPYAELLPPEKTLTPQELHAYQSVVMQVQHLQTQMQMKDSVIANYQATNADLMNKMHEKSNEPALLNSLIDVNKYKIFGGLLEVSKIQKFGKNDNFSIDLSKAFKLVEKKDT